MVFLNALFTFATAGIGGAHFPYAATLAILVGFVGAVSIGSIAWYNSRRPLGWEREERPDCIPEIDS
ncbi:MAG: hypothetical protein AAGM36_15785 [Cyanobacteria bacterium J06597_1]